MARLRAAFPGRELLFKIGRFSPDKRWNMAVDALAEEKRRGIDAAMVIRGGIEPHGVEVLANARAQGLSRSPTSGPRAILMEARRMRSPQLRGRTSTTSPAS